MAEDMTAPLLCGSGDPSAPSGPLPPVAILGSGDFSRSLAWRLASCGVRVVVGTRCVSRVRAGEFPEGVELRSQEGAVSQSGGVVFTALFPEHYPSLLGLRAGLAGKVLVDVSNAGDLKGTGRSNAELLAEMFPHSVVVKAFNTVSAWELLTGPHDRSKQVLVCSDSSAGKKKVQQLARQMGLHPVDAGGLSGSGALERAALRLFPSWGGPVTLTLLLFLFFYGYGFLGKVLLPFLATGDTPFYRLTFELVDHSLAGAALVTLALVYVPGVLAAWLQLRRGTKYRRFPSWLDRWLKRRKELGLLSFLCSALHATFSLCQPLRRLSAAHRQVQAGVWHSDLYLSCGVMGVALLLLLAITSLPSVGNLLSWREFSFVQSGLGYSALTLSVMHVLFFGWDSTFRVEAYPFHLPPAYVLAAAPPCLLLLARLSLALPCVRSRLARIRRGWESGRNCPALQRHHATPPEESLHTVEA